MNKKTEKFKTSIAGRLCLLRQVKYALRTELKCLKLHTSSRFARAVSKSTTFFYTPYETNLTYLKFFSVQKWCERQSTNLGKATFERLPIELNPVLRGYSEVTINDITLLITCKVLLTLPSPASLVLHISKKYYNAAYQIIKVTSFMMISKRMVKKTVIGLPDSPILLRIAPNATEKQTIPRMFILDEDSNPS